MWCSTQIVAGMLEKKQSNPRKRNSELRGQKRNHAVDRGFSKNGQQRILKQMRSKGLQLSICAVCSTRKSPIPYLGYERSVLDSSMMSSSWSPVIKPLLRTTVKMSSTSMSRNQTQALRRSNRRSGDDDAALFCGSFSHDSTTRKTSISVERSVVRDKICRKRSCCKTHQTSNVPTVQPVHILRRIQQQKPPSAGTNRFPWYLFLRSLHSTAICDELGD